MTLTFKNTALFLTTGLAFVVELYCAKLAYFTKGELYAGLFLAFVILLNVSFFALFVQIIRVGAEARKSRLIPHFLVIAGIGAVLMIGSPLASSSFPIL